jgi:hypothetical protein
MTDVYHCEECGSDTHDTIVHDPNPTPASQPRFEMWHDAAEWASSISAATLPVTREPIAGHYCGQTQPHAAHDWQTPPVYGSTALVATYQCGGLVGQVQGDLSGLVSDPQWAAVVKTTVQRGNPVRVFDVDYVPASRLDAAKSLADEWDSDEYADNDVTYGSCARELRAALTVAPDSGGRGAETGAVGSGGVE